MNFARGVGQGTGMMSDELGQQGQDMTGQGDMAGQGDMTGQGQELTTQQMIDKLAGILGGGSQQGMSEEEEFRIQQTARNFITDTQSVFRDELPEATRGQIMEFTEGLMSSDAGMIIRSVMAAMRTAEEKEANQEKTTGKDLPVQGGGGGKGVGQKAPRNLDQAALLADNLFR